MENLKIGVRFVLVGSAVAILLSTGVGCGRPHAEPGPVPFELPDETRRYLTGLGGNWMDDSIEAGVMIVWAEYQLDAYSHTEGISLNYVANWGPDEVRDAMEYYWNALNTDTKVEALGDTGFIVKGASAGVTVTKLMARDKTGANVEVEPGKCVELIKHPLELKGVNICR